MRDRRSISSAGKRSTIASFRPEGLSVLPLLDVRNASQAVSAATARALAKSPEREAEDPDVRAPIR